LEKEEEYRSFRQGWGRRKEKRHITGNPRFRRGEKDLPPGGGWYKDGKYKTEEDPLRRGWF